MYCKYIPCVIIIFVHHAYNLLNLKLMEPNNYVIPIHPPPPPPPFFSESSLLNEAVNVSTGEPFSTKIQIGTDIDVENSVANQIAISAE